MSAAPGARATRGGDSLISDHALLGGRRGGAPATSSGSIDWWCPERFDGHSVFSRLLHPDAGHWSFTLQGLTARRRRYLPGTVILETGRISAEGSVVPQPDTPLGAPRG
ncbi:hypothetical protein [Arthrobacter sp. ISL-30]|uniref:hypothetical protein n=1 Tax=Arthrobacter sp. ISL-30 TaxID=2819109 RepID=UPI001BEB8116|nr:hypothetical protein [Arthrobacter sp. ISL-30]MBT2515660.1 hypothetical protein [Arthrobacter sp. ISL-30]